MAAERLPHQVRLGDERRRVRTAAEQRRRQQAMLKTRALMTTDDH